MARLNDESHSIPEGHRHPSDQILSPQPCAPPNKDHLLVSFETSHHELDPDSVSVTVPNDIQMSRDYEYPSSSSSTNRSSSDMYSQDMEDDLDQLKSRASSRSSFSSIPASVVIHPLEKINSMRSMNPSEKIAAYTLEDDEARFGAFDDPPKNTMNMNMNIRTIRQREGAFRKPSSVRAMQMHTEDEADDDEYLTPPRRRGGIRSSPGTSPLKRSPYYSPTATANKQAKPKKEYPLVLLHCNLLAPSLPVNGASLPQNQDIVEEMLPAEYWKRWRRLQEKVGSGVTRDRGVLISHPEDLYDVLEERLLESLELQRARLHQGHFLGREENGDGSEEEYSDREEESETDGEQGDECPDCGGHVQRHSDNNRKWEIRVFAANGLMRAGAWAAAWKEMEKVDVEVGLWLPSDVRRALEKRLAEEQAVQDLGPGFGSVFDSAQSDVDPRRLSMQSHSRVGSGRRSLQAAPPANFVPASPEPEKPDLKTETKQPEVQQVDETKREPEKTPQIALQTLLINYIRVLAGDKRNIALVLMSVLTVFLAIGARPEQAGLTMPAFSADVVGFENTHSLSVEVPQMSGTPASFSQEEVIFSTSTASVPVYESIVSSAEAQAPPSATEEPSPSAIEIKPAPVESDIVSPEAPTASAEVVPPVSTEEASSSIDDSKQATSVPVYDSSVTTAELPLSSSTEEYFPSVDESTPTSVDSDVVPPESATASAEPELVSDADEIHTGSEPENAEVPIDTEAHSSDAELDSPSSTEVDLPTAIPFSAEDETIDSEPAPSEAPEPADLDSANLDSSELEEYTDLESQAESQRGQEFEV